jgi:hypothetical protein
MVTAALPLVRTDLEHGGRWTSLRIGGREWLWQRPDPARLHVRPGDAFVDAGGVEECVPTVRGVPDHGSAWSREWRREGNDDVLHCADFALRRTLSADARRVEARYVLAAEPGYRFIWAAHALLDLGMGARIDLPAGRPVRLYPETAPWLPGGWPAGARFVVGQWPALQLDEFGPDNGTAIGATVLETNTVQVRDGAHRLCMQLDASVPTSVSIWRNLGGYPKDAPYRSIGVEPMLGTVFDLADAGPDDAVTVPPSGQVEWRLRVSGA